MLLVSHIQHYLQQQEIKLEHHHYLNRIFHHAKTEKNQNYMLVEARGYHSMLVDNNVPTYLQAH
ncbi:hypothetical protein C2G38_2104421 [Gigaspora rosea]|uniref:Uncharacterized protein n=1 Tax=Gigaspora rosea TaxID=44941 RepID=A0A397ULS2_9GLOM|nr:hypothetical protein C2G38_2104421 [Gigaspora rosea]